MDKERRRYVRVRKPIVVQYKENSQSRWDMTLVKDISAGGMLITTDRAFPEGTVLNFRINLPSSPFQKFEVNGKVVSSKNMVARLSGEVLSSAFISRIQFFELNESQKQSLEFYIGSFLKQGGNL